MATDAKTTTRQLRIFGFAFGGGLSVLGGILYWRGFTSAPPWLWGVAGLLWLLALVAPQALRPLEKVMATIFRAVTAALTAILLTVFFFLILTPISLLMRLTRGDFLGRHFDRKRDSFWVTIPEDGPWSRPYKPF